MMHEAKPCMSKMATRRGLLAVCCSCWFVCPVTFVSYPRTENPMLTDVGHFIPMDRPSSKAHSVMTMLMRRWPTPARRLLPSLPAASIEVQDRIGPRHCQGLYQPLRVFELVAQCLHDFFELGLGLVGHVDGCLWSETIEQDVWE